MRELLTKLSQRVEMDASRAVDSGDLPALDRAMAEARVVTQLNRTLPRIAAENRLSERKAQSLLISPKVLASLDGWLGYGSLQGFLDSVETRLRHAFDARSAQARRYVFSGKDYGQLDRYLRKNKGWIGNRYPRLLMHGNYNAMTHIAKCLTAGRIPGEHLCLYLWFKCRDFNLTPGQWLDMDQRGLPVPALCKHVLKNIDFPVLICILYRDDGVYAFPLGLSGKASLVWDNGWHLEQKYAS